MVVEAMAEVMAVAKTRVGAEAVAKAVAVVKAVGKE